MLNLNPTTKKEYISDILKRVYSVLTIYEEKERIQDIVKQKAKRGNLEKHIRRLKKQLIHSQWILEPELGGKYIDIIVKVETLKKIVYSNFRHQEVKSLVLDTTNILSNAIEKLTEVEKDNLKG